MFFKLRKVGPSMKTYVLVILNVEEQRVGVTVNIDKFLLLSDISVSHYAFARSLALSYRSLMFMHSFMRKASQTSHSEQVFIYYFAISMTFDQTLKALVKGYGFLSIEGLKKRGEVGMKNLLIARREGMLRVQNSNETLNIQWHFCLLPHARLAGQTRDKLLALNPPPPLFSYIDPTFHFIY